MSAPKLSAATSASVLAAAIAILFNTALALLKDAYAPVNNWMKSLTGHHWTTHGLLDVVVFVGLGVIFLSTGLTENIAPDRLIKFLIGSVTISILGLILWFAT